MIIEISWKYLNFKNISTFNIKISWKEHHEK